MFSKVNIVHVTILSVHTFSYHTTVINLKGFAKNDIALLKVCTWLRHLRSAQALLTRYFSSLY